MSGKIITILMFVFLVRFNLSESINIGNDIHITELVEKIIEAKTSELSNKVLRLECIVVNQQKLIDRFIRQEEQKGRTIRNMAKTIADMQQQIKAKSNDVEVEEDNTDNVYPESEVRSEGMTRQNTSLNVGNKVQTVRQAKYETAGILGKSRRKRQPEVVAFSVYLSHDIDHMGIGHHIVFDKVLTNEGAGYNIYTGIFTAPTTGLYLFTFSINDFSQLTAIQMVVDGTNVVDIVDKPVNNIETMSSNTAIIHVNIGQSVWLQEYLVNEGSIHTGETWRYCSFSGVLLY